MTLAKLQRLRLTLAPICLAASMLFSAASGADPLPVAGLWLVEDKDGIIEVYPCGEAVCGKLVWLKEPLRPDGSIKRDDKNPKAELRARLLCGLELMTGFKLDDPNRWTDGHIYSPDDGDIYSAKMTLIDANTLRLRGYVGISLFGKSQIWTRAPGDSPRCSGS
jgi:uncharacterized protein (DUF2147 family)